MKKLIILILVALLLVTSAACAPAATSTTTAKPTSTTATTGATTTATTTEARSPYLVPFESQVEITLLGQIFAPYKAEQRDIYDEIEKRCNVKLTFEWAPSEGYASKISTMLSTASLPDMFRPGLDIPTLIKEGAIEPVDEYLQFAPHYSGMIESKDGSYVRNAADGKMYQLFYVFDFKPFQVLAIRMDWLDNLDLNVPVTWDEWVTVWKAFRDNDANKNGDANDEIPFTDPPMWTRGSMSSLLSVWGIKSNGVFYYDDSGKYELVFDHPRYREYLTAMRMLFTENLADKEVFTRTAVTAAQLFNTNVAGSGWVSIVRPQNTTATLSQTIPEAVLAPVVPMVGPYGDQYAPARNKFSNSWVVSYQAKKADKIGYIMGLLDWIFSEEGELLMNFGIEGTHHTVVNGKPVLVDDLMDSTFVKSREAGLVPQPFLFLWSGEMYKQVIAKNKAYDDLPLADQLMIDGTTLYNDYFYTIPATLTTEAWGQYSTDLMARIDELRANCITGKISIDDFFAEYGKLRSAGLDEINKQAQVAWDLVTR
jgi:putative aldouronate transport system substrate-binding protein